MRTKHSLVLVLSVLVAVVGLALADDSDNPEARAEWMKGYDRFELAQKAENAHQYAEAQAHYRIAHDIYVQVKAKYPKWNPFVLDYRIKFCRDKIRTLAAKTEIKQQGLTTDQVADANSRLRTELEGARNQVGELTGQNARLSQALEQARAEAARGSESSQLAEKLAWENRELKQRIGTLESRTHELVKEMQGLEEKKGLNEAYEKLREELAAMQQRRAEYEAAMKQMAGRHDEALEMNKRLSVERAQLELKVQEADAAGNATRRNLEQATQAVARLRETVEDQQQLLKQRDDHIAAHRQEIDRLRAGLAEVQKQTDDAQRVRQLYLAREKETSALRDEAQLLKDEMNKAKLQLARQQTNLDTLQVTNAQLRERSQLVDAARERLATLQDEHDKLRATMQQSQQGSAEAERRLRSQLDVSRSLKRDLDKAEAELASIRKRSAEREQEQAVRNHELQVDVERTRNAYELASRTRDVIATELQQLKERDQEARTQIATLTRELEVARAVQADGEKGGAAVVALREQVRTLAAQLEERAAGHDTAAADQEKLRTLELQAREAVVLREQLATLPELQANLARLELLQKQANQVPGLLSEIDQYKRRLADLEELRTEDGAERNISQVLNERLERTETEIRQKTEEVNTLRQKLGQATAELTDVRQLAEARALGLTELQTQANASQTQVRQLGEAAATLREQLAAATQGVTAAREARDQATTANQQLRQQVGALEEKMAAVTAARTELQAKLQEGQASEALAASREQLGKVEAQVDQLQKLVAAQRDLMRQKDSRFSKAEEERETLTQQLEEMTRQRRAETQALKNQLTKALDEYNRQRQLAEEAIAARQQAEKTLEAADVRSVAAGGLTRAEQEELHRRLEQALQAEQAASIEGAIWFYKQALELDPDNSRALIRLGNIMADKGEYAQAESYLMRAFYQNPDHQDILLPLGFILIRTEKGDLAISMLSRAVALFPENADFHRFLGVAHRSLGWIDAAEVQFRRSHELDQSNPDTAFNLAILYSTVEPPQVEKAKEWYDKAKALGAELDPGMERLFQKTN